MSDLRFCTEDSAGYVPVRRAQTLCLLSIVLLFVGCSLPGYSSNPVKGDAWYNFGANSEATYQDQLDSAPVEYDARIVKITPSLIQHQKDETAHESLPPEQRALLAPDGYRAYEIGPGDVLRFTVFGQSGLNTTSTQTADAGSSDTGPSTSGATVDSDGEVFFPYIGQIKAAGLTTAQLRQTVTQKLKAYVREPQVDVSVGQYRSQNIFISGDAGKPCSVALTDVVQTAFQALEQCGTLKSTVQSLVLLRGGRSTFVDLDQIYASGESLPLQAGDRLIIDGNANRVFAMGEFTRQQDIAFPPGGLSLSDAIAAAGGVSLNTANVSKVYVVRGFIDSQSVVDGKLKTVMRPNVYKLDMSDVGGLLLANQFQLRPRDIVFAAPASLVNFNRALSQITPSLNIILQSLLLYDRAGNN